MGSAMVIVASFDAQPLLTLAAILCRTTFKGSADLLPFSMREIVHLQTGQVCSTRLSIFSTLTENLFFVTIVW
jgi:hypothetical protein